MEMSNTTGRTTFSKDGFWILGERETHEIDFDFNNVGNQLFVWQTEKESRVLD